ncbi:MAG: TerB family tellurite resistance protein [Leptolyngbyaceae bacterium]|nr:TerB family tellurite resistance protein [Leptolyngbyaceae bacterium]
MSLQPPPSITPRQMTLLRIVASMAWSDGNLATEEVDLMLDRFSHLFTSDPEQQKGLQQELREYLVQNIPLSELVPKLESLEERKLVLQLGYEVIVSSSRTPDEEKINQEEAAAYQQLMQLLDLPPEAVAEVEATNRSSEPQAGIVDSLVNQLQKFIHG